MGDIPVDSLLLHVLVVFLAGISFVSEDYIRLYSVTFTSLAALLTTVATMNCFSVASCGLYPFHQSFRFICMRRLSLSVELIRVILIPSFALFSISSFTIPFLDSISSFFSSISFFLSSISFFFFSRPSFVASSRGICFPSSCQNSLSSIASISSASFMSFFICFPSVSRSAFLYSEASAYALVPSTLTMSNETSQSSCALRTICTNIGARNAHFSVRNRAIVRKSGLLSPARNMKARSDWVFAASFLLEKV